MEDPDRWPPRLLRSPWAIAGLALLGAAGLLALWTWRAEARALTEGVVLRARAAGPGPFFAGMALLPAVGFPLMPFTLAAGPVFGATLGPGGALAGCLAAVMVNVTLSYALARALRPWVTRLAARWGYTLPQSEGVTAWQLAAVVRLTPGPPFWLQSYLLGIVRVPFVPYLVVSTVVPAGYLAGVILAGDALYRGRWTGVWFGVGLLVLAGIGIHWIRRRRGLPAAASRARPVADEPVRSSRP